MVYNIVMSYKEEARKARDEFLTELKHKIVFDLLEAGLTDTEVTKVTGLSKQLVGWIKKNKVEQPLSEPLTK
jgi:DNA invertase Pin-like site-specific DNA recombinase